MKIALPTSLWSLGRELVSTGYNPSTQAFYSLAMVSEETEVDLPNFFDQVTRGHNTTVCHGKVKQASPNVLSGLDEYREKYASEFERYEWWGFNPNIEYAYPAEANGWFNWYGTKIECYPAHFGTPDAIRVVTNVIVQNRTAYDYSKSTVKITVYNDFCPNIPASMPATVNGTRLAYRTSFDVDEPVRSLRPEKYFTYPDVPYDRSYTMYYGNYATECACQPIYDLDSIPKAYYFAFGEPGFVRGHNPLPDVIKVGMQDAFLNAADQFPTMADNNLSNMKDVADIVLDIITGHFPDTLPKTLGELWMWWRYSYSTTKDDTKQALDYAVRKHITWLKPVHFNGQVRIDGSAYRIDDPIEIRCGFDVVQQTGNLLATLQNQAHVAGVELTAYRVWDFIPFSFVVDWFGSVGDRLKLRDTIRHLEQDYEIFNCVFSVKYTRKFEGGSTQHYTRWYQGPPSLTNYTWHSSTSPSTKTVLKRTADSFVMASSMLM
jgi:hypothetical protein